MFVKTVKPTEEMLPDKIWTSEMGKFKKSDEFCKRIGYSKEVVESKI